MSGNEDWQGSRTDLPLRYSGINSSVEVLSSCTLLRVGPEREKRAPVPLPLGELTFHPVVKRCGRWNEPH